MEVDKLKSIEQKHAMVCKGINRSDNIVCLKSH